MIYSLITVLLITILREALKKSPTFLDNVTSFPIVFKASLSELLMFVRKSLRYEAMRHECDLN